jgi:hypothetical protein
VQPQELEQRLGSAALTTSNDCTGRHQYDLGQPAPTQSYARAQTRAYANHTHSTASTASLTRSTTFAGTATTTAAAVGTRSTFADGCVERRNFEHHVWMEALASMVQAWSLSPNVAPVAAPSLAHART